jgi:hypothetical protein
VSGEPSGARAAILYVAGVIAILFSAAICVSLQALAPLGPGPAYVLFPYHGELVGIGLVGGVVPLIVSAMMVAASSFGRERGAHPFEGRAYWTAMLLVALFITLLFSASHAVYGGIGLSRLWAFGLVLMGCVAGVYYWWFRGRRLGAVDGVAECYVMGTLGVFSSDVVRTFTGLASAPGEAAVWGGGGFLDILFWFGLYVALSFLTFLAFHSLLIRAYDALVGKGRSEAPGPARPGLL